MPRNRREPRGRAPRRSATPRAGALLLVVLALPWPVSGQPATSWSRVVPAGLAPPVLAVAVGPDGRHWAVGDARGVIRLGPDGRGRRWPSTGPTRDLVFGAGGTLWAATEAGLVELPERGEPRDATPAPTAGARRVHRVAASRGWVAVATDAGVYWRGPDPDPAWQGLGPAFRLRPASAVAWGSGPAGAVLWAAGPTQAIRIEPSGRNEPLRFSLPRPGLEVLDLAAGWGGAELALLARRGLALRRDGRWAWIRTTWPPGIVPRRLAASPGRLWIVTDRGLLHAGHPEGPWERAKPPAGRAEAFALGVRGQDLLCAAREGLLVLRGGAAAAPERRGLADEPVRCAPPVAEVQRVALHYTGLRRSRATALREALRRRGLYPEVTLHGSYEAGRDRGLDRDQAFVSGGLRRLRDREHDRSRDFEVGLTLEWELWRLAYDPEALDIAEEERRRVELRDDVLDEINQLYFERLGLIQSLAASGTAPVGASRLRVLELTAGLDAWTGGWFGDHATCSPPSPVP